MGTRFQEAKMSCRAVDIKRVSVFFFFVGSRCHSGLAQSPSIKGLAAVGLGHYHTVSRLWRNSSTNHVNNLKPRISVATETLNDRHSEAAFQTDDRTQLPSLPSPFSTRVSTISFKPVVKAIALNYTPMPIFILHQPHHPTSDLSLSGLK